MIRVRLFARSTIPAVRSIVFLVNRTSADATSRSFNSYHHPHPYYDEPVGGRYQAEPRGSQYHPVRFHVSECYCRCCGRPFWGYYPHHYPPVSHGGVGYTRNHDGSGFDRTLEYGGYYPDAGHMQYSGDHYFNRRVAPLDSYPEQCRDFVTDGRDRNAWPHSRSNYNNGYEHSVSMDGNGLNQRNGYVDQKNGNIGNRARLQRSFDGQPEGSFVNGQPVKSNRANGEFQHYRQSPRNLDVVGNESLHGPPNHNQNINSQIGSNSGQDGVWGNYNHQNSSSSNIENLNGFHHNPTIRQGENLNTNPHSQQYQERFNVANVGEAGRRLHVSQVGELNSVNAGYLLSRDSGNTSNMYNPRPGLAVDDQPMKPNVINAENSQVRNINYSRNDGGVSHGSNEAAGRCQRIIDVLETEDKQGLKAPGNRFISQSRK